MSSFKNRSKYIMLAKSKCGEIEVPQGEIFEEVARSDFADVISLVDVRRKLRLTCPYKMVARLTNATAEYLMGFSSLEERYHVFQLINGFENLPTNGSMVFVAVKGREYCGIVQSTSWNYNSPVFVVQLIDEVEYEHANVTDGQTAIQLDVMYRLPNGGSAVNVSLNKLRPACESMEILHTSTFFRINGFLYYLPMLQFSPEKERFDMPGRENQNIGQFYMKSGSLGCMDLDEPTARTGYDVGDQRLRVGVGHLSAKEKRAREELLEKLTYEKRKTNRCYDKLCDLEKTLDEEQKAHQQTKELLKEKSQRFEELEVLQASTQKSLDDKEKALVFIEQMSVRMERDWTIKQETFEELQTRCDRTKLEFNELERQLASERKAREEAESTQKTTEQNSEKKIKELQTTLATAQISLKTKRDPDKQVDWTLNRDEIHVTEQELGSGAFGTVYKGKFRATQVAVKKFLMKPTITEYNKDNFRREMRMAARCRHPCMLQFIGATNDDQSPLLVTELLDTSLKCILLERALEPIEITIIALDVAKGLNYLHLNQPNPIVHRDVSSGNVLLWKHGEVWRGKVSDYGNAVMMNYARTGSGGALPYLAPEVDNKKFSTKSDVYSYGVLLLEMYHRKEPSSWDDRDELTCLVENADLRSLIRGCLEQEPAQRLSMEEIISKL